MRTGAYYTCLEETDGTKPFTAWGGDRGLTVMSEIRFDLLRIHAGSEMPAYELQNRVPYDPLVSYSRLLQVWRIPNVQIERQPSLD
jgi:hypothetical protein